VSRVCLLDANVLIAMMWPAHAAHVKVQRWLSTRAAEKWASCPMTQAAFVRIVSNPAFSPNALTPANALALLRSNLEHHGHEFWRDEIQLTEAVELTQAKLVGHQQITDAYLLGLAGRKKGKLVTLDRNVPALMAQTAEKRDLVVVL